jgi:anti-sigma factor ChrR (cupin superfamily)
MSRGLTSRGLMSRKPMKRKQTNEGSKSEEAAEDVLNEALVQAMASAVAPAELTAADRDSMHTRILARIRSEPPPNTFTIRAADMRWVTVGPGVEVKVLRMDRERNDQTVLIRMQPGSLVVGHRHTQEEECLVLEGEVFIGDYCLKEGDMHVARPGAKHPPIHAPRGALLMIRSEMPPQNFRIA